MEYGGGNILFLDWRLYIAFGYKIFRSIISVISEKKKEKGQEEGNIKEDFLGLRRQTLYCLRLTESLGS